MAKSSLIKIFFLQCAACAFLAVPAVAATTDLTSSAGYTGPSLMLGAFVDGQYNFTFGPKTLPGGITFTAAPGGGGNSGMGSVIGQGSYGLGSNGSFGGDAVYIGVDSTTGFDTLSFATPIMSFGAFFNYYTPVLGNDPTISAFDSSNNLLGTFDLATTAPISTPGGFNQFAFRGISSDTADISSIEFGGSYLLAAGTADGTVVTPPSGAPAPLAGAGLISFLGAGGLSVRRRLKALISALLPSRLAMA